MAIKVLGWMGLENLSTPLTISESLAEYRKGECNIAGLWCKLIHGFVLYFGWIFWYRHESM